MKKSIALVLLLAMVFALFGASAAAAPAEKEDVYILYTNDTHCGTDTGLTMQGLSAMKNAMQTLGMNVLLVDNGDAIQGEVIGSISKGEYLIELMNAVPYDIATPGNHEFDYTLERFLELTKKAEFPYISANFMDKNGKLVFKPYEIAIIGGWKIAFVGATTPETVSSSTPTYFVDEKGNPKYSFCQDESGEAFYKAIQAAVDDAKKDGADFVIVMAHLGIEGSASPWTSSELIENTTGIDAVLDGHSHSVIEGEKVKNANGKEVLLTSTGTKFENVGVLTIDTDGRISTKLVKDNGFSGIIKKIESSYEDEIKKVVAHTDVDLCVDDPASGVCIIRRAETNLGDLIADAFRVKAGADCAIINGGTFRTGLPVGNITYGDSINMNPFANKLCMIEATGQTILDALEFSVAFLPEEFDGFLQVSGISFTVDMNVDSPVKTDVDSNFVGIIGERRVRDAKIGGKDIDPEKTYTLAGQTYILKLAGNGYTMFKGSKLLLDETMLDSELFADFIMNDLGGTVGKEYADPYGDGRITFIEAK